MNLRKELAQAIHKENYDVTEDGIYFPLQGVVAAGEYFDRINKGEWQTSKNLVPTEGLAHILSVALAATAKPAGYYLALFSGGATPAANWTAASFASAASEIVSQSEGYTSATRPVWTPPASTATGQIDNLLSVASLTMATASSLNVTGAALLTNNVRGGTTGALISATKYPTTRVFQNGDTYDVGYRINLTV